MARGNRRKLQGPVVRRCPKNTVIAAPDPDPGPRATRPGRAGRPWSPDRRCAPSGVATKGGSGACPERSRRGDWFGRATPVPGSPLRAVRVTTMG